MMGGALTLPVPRSSVVSLYLTVQLGVMTGGALTLQVPMSGQLSGEYMDGRRADRTSAKEC